jgi:DNA-binding NarL/FixJ family response regulator
MKTTIPHRFLLISDAADDHWNQVLRESLAVLGPLQIVSEKEAAAFLQMHVYDIVIVDAGAVSSAPKELIRQIHELRPGARVVVVTASPHWKIAKAVIRAGAADYVEKMLNREEILARFGKILEQ